MTFLSTPPYPHDPAKYRVIQRWLGTDKELPKFVYTEISNCMNKSDAGWYVEPEMASNSLSKKLGERRPYWLDHPIQPRAIEFFFKNFYMGMVEAHERGFCNGPEHYAVSTNGGPMAHMAISLCENKVVLFVTNLEAFGQFLEDIANLQRVPTATSRYKLQLCAGDITNNGFTMQVAADYLYENKANHSLPGYQKRLQEHLDRAAQHRKNESRSLA